MRLYEIDGAKYPSVTTILGATRSKKSEDTLNNWKKRLGEDEAQKFTNNACARGTALHSLAEAYLIGKPQDFSHPEVEPFWKSIEPALKRINEVYATEQRVYHPTLKYAGTFDAYGTFDAVEHTMIDFKTSSRPKEPKWITDYYLQLSAYSAAFYALTGISTNGGVIIVALADRPAQIFKLDRSMMLMYWDLWLERLNTFYRLHPHLKN